MSLPVKRDPDAPIQPDAIYRDGEQIHGEPDDEDIFQRAFRKVHEHQDSILYKHQKEMAREIYENSFVDQQTPQSKHIHTDLSPGSILDAIANFWRK